MSRFNQDPSESRRSVIRKTSLFAFVFCIIIFVLGLNGRQPMGDVQTGAEDIGARVMSILSMPARGLERFFGSFDNYFNVMDENTRLRTEVTRLGQLENEDLALREKIAYLEDFLETEIDFGQDDRQIIARSVSENDGPFVKSTLINAGSNRGVEHGDAVVTSDGLYGRVVRRGLNSARVLLLNDLSSRIPVMSLRSRSRAILSGVNGTVPELNFRGDGDWLIGDRVITSGDDGALPRGLAIGTVIGVRPDVLGVALYTDRAPVDWVRILPFAPIETPESNPVPNIETETEQGAFETPLPSDPVPAVTGGQP